MKLNDCLVYGGCALLFLAANGLPFDRFTNYTSVLRVNDFAYDNSLIWVASSGGLYRYNPVNKTGTLYTDPELFPDPYITSLCLDAKHTLWIGTSSGYLYKRPRQGFQTVISSYFMAGWPITDMVSYGRYLIIGSSKGCSVFDTEQLAALKNATSFGTALGASQVAAIAIFKDTLFVGCDRGVAKLFIGGDRLAKANFYDPSIWQTDTTNLFSVRSFVMTGNSCRALQIPGTLFGGQVVTAVPQSTNDTTWCDLFADSTRKLTIPGNVTVIESGNGYGCCIGTKFNYFYLWNGSDTSQVKIDGPTFSDATRVYVDHEGQTWVCFGKTGIFPYNKWWEGVSVFRNGQWDLYSPADGNHSSMGSMLGGGITATEDRQGRMWFGFFGGHVKRYDRLTDSMTNYCVCATSYGNGEFFQSTNCHSMWGMSSAVACDSAGFLWIADWTNNWGSLICYDPRYAPDPYAANPLSRHYRYFFPPGDPNYSPNFGCLCVDAANNIIAGEGTGGTGTITVFSHNGNPLADSVQIKAVFSGSGKTVFDASTTKDTLTYLATSTGLYTYNPKINRLAGGLRVPNNLSVISPDTLIDSTLKNIEAVEVEDRQTLWLGTIDSGLIRYDLSNSSKTAITETHGLLSNNIWDLSLDRKNGYLWIATDRGVSRYMLGYSIGPKNIGTTLVYPNPYSKRRHREMVFEKLPPSSKLFIYSVSGTLIAVLSPQANSSYGSACVWNPPAKIVPGIYLYVVQSSAKNSQGKIIVTP